VREIVQSDDAPAATAGASGAKSGATSSVPAVGPDSNVEAVAMDGTIVPASGTTTAATASDTSSSTAPVSGGAFAKAIFFMLGLMFVLPIIGNLSAGGILSLAIMGFGIRQAWLMNAAVAIPITGPHRVGASADVALDPPTAR